MSITLIVLSSIVLYLFIGFVGTRPVLEPLYESYKRLSSFRPPQQIVQLVAWTMVPLIILWPVTVMWVLAWKMALKRTPQYQQMLAEKEASMQRAALLDAQRVIADFQKRGSV